MKKTDITSISKTATVFITSQLAANLAMRNEETRNAGFFGKRFALNTYASKDAFIKAATDYVISELNDPKPELCFMDIEADFCIEVFVSDDGNISKELWKIFDLNDSDFKILNGYVSHYANLNYNVMDRGVEHALREANKLYDAMTPQL